jgi:hypothetical protein
VRAVRLHQLDFRQAQLFSTGEVICRLIPKIHLAITSVYKLAVMSMFHSVPEELAFR